MVEITPKIFNLFMKPFEKRALSKRRKELIPKVYGNVLEIGAGTGVNFDYYSSNKLVKLTVLDLKFNSFIRSKPLNKKIKINYIEGSAEELPFEDETFDCVVSTLIYCSVENPQRALSEVYRVLKPGGKCILLNMYYLKKNILGT